MTKQAELSKPINDEAMKKVKDVPQARAGHAAPLRSSSSSAGPTALTDAEIAKKLSVTDEQAAKVKTILADMQAEMRETPPVGRRRPPGR